MSYKTYMSYQHREILHGWAFGRSVLRCGKKKSFGAKPYQVKTYADTV